MAKILLVDDAAFMRMRCKKLLTDEGHNVIEAENGADGVEKYKSETPDLVLMDITMPIMDGITALKEIRQHDQSASIAMVSAMGQQAMVMEAIKAGAKDFILKPFEPEKVLKTVRKLVG